MSTPGLKKAYFAGGCFWGVQYYFKSAKGVIKTTVGYIGGTKEKPTYEEVCAHGTGHAEAIEVEFDPTKTSYEDLAKLFFEIHNPTELNRQGPDIGDQYRSAIFYISEQQKKTAEKLITILKEKGFDIKTTLEPAAPLEPKTSFYPAENYHQDYYGKNGHEPYCHVFTKRF